MKSNGVVASATKTRHNQATSLVFAPASFLRRQHQENAADWCLTAQLLALLASGGYSLRGSQNQSSCALMEEATPAKKSTKATVPAAQAGVEQARPAATRVFDTVFGKTAPASYCAVQLHAKRKIHGLDARSRVEQEE